jgi:hypothetical protein
MSGFWKHIEELVAFLYSRYPMEMIQYEIQAKMRRDTALNKFNSTKDKTLRSPGGMPYRLDLLIKKIYGQDLPMSQKGFYNEFFRRYRQFAYAEKI